MLLPRLGGNRACSVVWNCSSTQLAVTPLESAARAAERIRRSVGATPINIGDLHVTVTVSGGCAADSAGDVDGLICRADFAMYQAKAAGRDRVVTDSRAPDRLDSAQTP